MGEGDLDFVIPKSNSEDFDIREIPKTIIYIDQKSSALTLASVLRRNLPKGLQQRPPRPKRWDADPRSVAEKTITIYHADVSDTMKRYIRDDWNNGQARIMIATSAWGMGINDRGVERVIQWSITHLENLDTLMQRFGRYARDSNMQGLCLLFTEKWSVGPRAPKTKLRKNDENKRATPAERRAGIDDGIYKFINTPGHQKCKRRVILGHFGDPEYKSESLSTIACCDSCNPEMMERFAPIIQSLTTNKKVLHSFPRAPPALQVSLKLALIEFRAQLFKRDYPEEDFLTDTDIFDDQQLTKFASYCRGVQTKEHLLLIPGLTMDKFLYNTYAEEIFSFISKYLAESRINPQPRSGTQAETRRIDTELNPTNLGPPSGPPPSGPPPSGPPLGLPLEPPLEPPTAHDKYAGLTNENLKALLKARSLPVSGVKTQLLDRLIQHDTLLAAAGKPDIPATKIATDNARAARTARTILNEISPSNLNSPAARLSKRKAPPASRSTKRPRLETLPQTPAQ